MKRLPSKKGFVPIGVAAGTLGISIDTVRRWEKQGILQAVRFDNKRYFSVKALREMNSSRPLTISDAAKYLDLSEWTLRRLDQKKILTASRNKLGERIYEKESLESFLNSDYFSRQRDTSLKNVPVIGDHIQIQPLFHLKILSLAASLLLIFSYLSLFSSSHPNGMHTVNKSKQVLAVSDTGAKEKEDPSFFWKNFQIFFQ